jgi:hypothetical protein
MISFDAEALFPSVPISDCIDVIGAQLEIDDTLKSHTNLTPTDIANLLNLCLSISNFIYNARHHTTNDRNIGLSLMVIVYQLWMMHNMERALQIGKKHGFILPRHIFIYMDDCWCLLRRQKLPRRPGLRSNTA